MPCGFISGVHREKVCDSPASEIFAMLHRRHKIVLRFFVCLLFLQNHGHEALVERANSIEILLLLKFISDSVKYILSPMRKVAETQTNMRCVLSRETAEFSCCINSWS